MNAGLASQISEAIKTAMRAHDSLRVGTLRLLQAAIRQKAIDERVEPDDDAILGLIEKQAKQRRESIAAFEKAGRLESAQKERAELAILQAFLPQAASREEIDQAIENALAQAHAQGMRDGALMGAVMRALKASLAGRADLAEVSARVRARLAH